MTARAIRAPSLRELRLAVIRTRLIRDNRRLRAAFERDARQQGFAAALGHELAAVSRALAQVEWQFWLVLGVSAAVMAVMQFNVPLWYGGSDHADYYNYGRYLLGWGPWTYPMQWRTPGMGIFYILSGPLLLGTWKGFIALFALFSVAIPVFTYLMVRPHSRGFAVLAALAVVLSMTPYVYAADAGSEQPYFFLHALVLWLCCLFFWRRTDRGLGLPITIAIVAAYLTMVRPVGALIFWLFAFVAILARPRDWRRIACASGVYVAIMAAWCVWDRDYGTNLNASPTVFYGFPNPIATTAERRFAEAYYSPAGLVHAESDAAAQDYPQSLALRALLRAFVTAHSKAWEEPSALTPRSYFQRYAGRPDALLDAFFTEPNTLYLDFIEHAVGQTLGDAEAQRLLYAVAREHGTTGLYGEIASFARNPGRLLMGAVPNLSGRTLFEIFFRANYTRHMGRIYSITDLPQPMLTPDLGPAAAMLLATVRNVVFDYPDFWRQTGGPLGGPYTAGGGPEEFYRALVRDDYTTTEPESQIYMMLSSVLGAGPSGRLYTQVAFEILARHPRLALIFCDNFLNLTLLRNFGSDAHPFDRTWLTQQSDAYVPHRVQLVDGLTNSLARGLAKDAGPNATLDNAEALETAVYLVSPLFLVAFILALPLLRGRAIIVPAGFLFLVYLYEVTTLAVFTPWGAMRYEATFYVLPWVMACMIAGEAYSRRAQRSARIS
jgi:hypothetical protein